MLNSPEFGEQSCELADGVISLGRSRQNQIVLIHETVSARHCEFLVNGSDVILRDLGSRNGTFIDGVRLKVQSGVRHGQRLRFGKVEAQLQLNAAFPFEDTDITAYHAHRRALRNASSPAPGHPQYPVVFTARTPNATDALTSSLPAPPAFEPTADTARIVRPGLATRGWRRVVTLFRKPR